jgi:hypothetical protein
VHDAAQLPERLARESAMSYAPHFDIDIPAFWADPYPVLA